MMTVLEIALSKLPEGILIGEEKRIALRALEEHWDNLGGSSEESTSGDKLYRAESLAWNSPVLSFVLERHGGTVNGSTRANLHHWSVDVETNEAHIFKRGHRQLHPMDKRLDVKKLAEEVSERILAGEFHKTLKWTGEETVAVCIAEVIPEGNQQTTASRRKLFYKALDEKLSLNGWTKKQRGSKIEFVRCPD